MTRGKRIQMPLVSKTQAVPAMRNPSGIFFRYGSSGRRLLGSMQGQ
jgi:hypothetical protein